MPIHILMPALSPTMTEGNLVKWHKNEGDTIKAGMVLAEIETDKATMEVEAVDEGILGKIVIPAGSDNVKVNSIMGVILEEGETLEAIASMVFETPAPAVTRTDAPQAAVAPAPLPVANTPASTTPAEGSRVFITPLAKRIALQKNINIHAIKGSGPHGRIVKADVENMSATSGASAAYAPMVIGDAAFEDIKLGGMRKVIAQRLTQSKQLAPHFYLTVDCDLGALMSLRKQLNERPSAPTKLSVNDFVIRACAMALMEVPAANAMWMDSHVRLFKQADVAVAVAIDGGLVTPVIKGANLKPLTALSSEMKTLAERARAGSLLPEEYQGGSFTISNLGMYGIRTFSAIINYPQAAILAVGAGEERVVVRSGHMQIATMMDCTLSVDHRVIDGAVGAQFLQVFKRLMENPLEMLTFS
jgi:pyruvate dehydrogenase E2 component (dihydrolipoamide acetyltransferase)